jgi:iron complex outermembrane receptor protein
MLKPASLYCAFLASSLGLAQENSPPSPPPAAPAVESATQAEKPAASSEKKAESGKKAERIQVTGSRIKRIDAEGPAPVQVIDREAIDQAGVSTVSDLLREIPASSFGSTREQSNRGAPGFAGVDLRGLGGKYTLVLLDGRRLAADPIFDAVDIGDFPVAMIERVEILKEGASAVYGSDAVGGVVNIITRKDMTGTSVLTALSQPAEKGGVEQRAEIVSGAQLGSTNVMIAGSYRKKEEIFARDRSFIGDGWSPTGNPGTFRPLVKTDKPDTNGNPTFAVKQGVFLRPDPNCQTTETSRVQQVGDNIFCQYNFEKVRTIAPSIEQLGLLVKAEHEFNSKISGYVLAKATRKEARDLIAPLPATVDVTDREAVVAIKNALGAAGSTIDPEAGDGVRLQYRTTELGLRDTLTDETNTQGVVGLKGNLQSGWDWDFSYSRNQVEREEKGVGGFWIQPKLLGLLRTGQFNPFDPNRNGAALQEAAYEPRETQLSNMEQYNLVFSGSALEMANGPLAIALGASYSKENYKTDGDAETLAGNVPGSAASKGGGDRDVQAVFTELSVPVAQGWEVSLAGRVDAYKEYGTAFNPRLATSYKTSDWLLRGSVGTGFRAPTLQEERVENDFGYPSFVDNVQCEAARETGNAARISQLCREQQYLLNVVAPGDLKPEKVLLGNIGAVFAPSVNFNIGLDTWFVRINDRIGTPDLSILTLAEAKGERGYEQYGIKINRNADGSLIDITAPAANLAQQEVAGIDLSSAFRIGNTKSLAFGWNLDTSYQLFNREAAFEGQELENRIGQAGRPQWRANNTLTIDTVGSHRVALTGRTTGSVERVNPDLGKLPIYTEYDAQYTFGALFNGAFSLGALNVTNAKPPADQSSNPSLNYDIYSYAGRTYYARITQNF